MALMFLLKICLCGLKCAEPIAAWSFSQIENSWKMAVQKQCDVMLENEMHSLDCEPA